MLSKEFLLAIGTLIGTIIGGGIFGIPYVVSRSGVLLSFFYFLLIGIVVLLLHLFFGEIVLSTKGSHRLVGYAKEYLGKKAKFFATLSVFFGTVGSLLTYLILGGDFLKIIVPLPLSSFQFTIIFWAVLSLFVYLGIRKIAKAEFLMNLGLFLAFLLIFIFSISQIKLDNFILTGKEYIFLPFGVFLFSLVGWNAVPEIKEILSKKKALKKIIVFGVILPAVLYFVFGLIISGVSGARTTTEAFQGLLPFLGKKIVMLGGIFGLLAISTSFLVLSNYLKNTLVFDYKLHYFPSFLIASFLPFALFLLGIREFLFVVAFVGTFVGLIDGVIIIALYKKVKKLKERIPEYSLKTSSFLLYMVVAVLIFGVFSQIIYYLK
jgi:tyrosine-specific transport protein